MNKEDKAAVLQAMKKLKRANRNVDDIDQAENSGGKNRKNKDDDSIVDSIINAVSNLKGRD